MKEASPTLDRNVQYVQWNLDYPDSSGARLIVRIIENMNINDIRNVNKRYTTKKA